MANLVMEGSLWTRDSWYEATAWPPRYCGGARCSTTIHALTVGRRGASREASRHGDHRPGSAQTRESTVTHSGRRHDHRPSHRDEPGAVHGRARGPAARAHSMKLNVMCG